MTCTPESNFKPLLVRMRTLASQVYMAAGNRLLRYERAFLVILFVVALTLRLFYLVIFVGLDAEPMYDGIGYDLLATALLKGQGYAYETGEPTAFRPPVYPLFLAGVYALTDHSFVAVRVIQAVLDALTALVVYFIAKDLFHQRVALLAGLGTAFYPLLIYETGLIIPESLSYSLQFSAVWCLIAMLRRDQLSLPLAAGVLMGLTVLARPTAILWMPLILGWITLSGLLRKPAFKLAATVLGLALVFGPWIARNYVTFNAFIPVSSLGGNGIWTGNNPLAQGGGIEPGPATWAGSDYPTQGWYGWKGLSEIESSRRFAAKGLAWIRDNPESFILLVPKKLLRLWSPVSYSTQFGRRAADVLVALVLPPYLIFLTLAVHGILLVWRRWRQVFPLLAIIISVNILSMIYFGATRYGIPMAVSLVIFAAVSTDSVLGRQSRTTT